MLIYQAGQRCLLKPVIVIPMRSKGSKRTITIMSLVRNTLKLGINRSINYVIDTEQRVVKDLKWCLIMLLVTKATTTITVFKSPAFIPN